jgi:putative ABC transport system permease protein
MIFLAVAKDIGSVSDSGSVRQILFLGAIIIGIFSLIFLFYTNSFLIKRRKKEIGLYNILGMEKKHIARIMFMETIVIAVLSFSIGLSSGIILSKLMILLLLKIISFDATFGFEIPLMAVLATVLLFCTIFIINLIYNIFQVHLAKPIELLKGGNLGEKEPKTKWILASIGAICLGIGYYIAVTTESPIAALNLFFIAVALVIVGTYFIFTASSIAILKMLRKNKKYYYKINHFISVSGMIYRMKQNAAGLANICILSTAVIIMISTTVSLYMGVEDVLRNAFPRNIVIKSFNASKEYEEFIENSVEKHTTIANLEPKNIIKYHLMNFVLNQDESNFVKYQEDSFNVDNYSKMSTLKFTIIDDYNRLENKSVTLSKGEVLLYEQRGEISEDIININGLKLSIKEHLSSLNSMTATNESLTNNYVIVVNDINTIKQVQNAIYSGTDYEMEELSYYYAFDLAGSKEEQIKIVNNLQKEFANDDLDGYSRAEGAEISRDSFYTIYGGLFFLGIFLGVLFIMATVLIIYYKQIAEGYDDKERFEIMQKVGMSHDEVKHAIKAQVLTVFFLPLVAAVIHIAFAFKVITKLLLLFNLTNTSLFLACTIATILIFALFYSIVYALTARTYYRIVS